MDLSFRVESSLAKTVWKLLKIIITVIWKRIKSDHRKLVGGLVETIKQGNLERNASKVFHVNSSPHDFEFSCKNSPNPIVRFELAKNRRRYFPCMSLPTFIEDYEDKECYVGRNCEVLVSVMGTPTFINLNTLSPLLSPYPMNFSNYTPDNEVDLKAEEFISRFRSQFLKLR